MSTSNTSTADSAESAADPIVFAIRQSPNGDLYVTDAVGTMLRDPIFLGGLASMMQDKAEEARKVRIASAVVSLPSPATYPASPTPQTMALTPSPTPEGATCVLQNKSGIPVAAMIRESLQAPPTSAPTPERHTALKTALEFINNNAEGLLCMPNGRHVENALGVCYPTSDGTPRFQAVAWDAAWLLSFLRSQGYQKVETLPGEWVREGLAEQRGPKPGFALLKLAGKDRVDCILFTEKAIRQTLPFDAALRQNPWSLRFDGRFAPAAARQEDW